MAGEVVANAKKVLNLAFQGVEALDALLDEHADAIEKAKQPVSTPLQSSGVVRVRIHDEAERIAYDLTNLKRRALIAESTITLTDEQAEILGAISDRSFFDEWAADFESEYGVAK